MCGIAGFADLSSSTGDSEFELRQMLKRIVHRGPDDSGIYVANGIALGHQRLSIIDLSAQGHQPMRSQDGKFVIVFNGEIYNYEVLEAELRARGRRFVGRSDTEVLLVLIEEFGLESALKKCVGMFAVAVWNTHDRVLQLARDRFGEKPLYYGWHNGVFLFGSELKALAAHRSFSRCVDPDSISELLRFGYIAAPNSIYLRTKKLLPGSILTLHVPVDSRDSSRLLSSMSNCKKFWSHQDVMLSGLENPYKGTYEDAVEVLESLISRAVEMQLHADVPLGAFLSGGIDSSLIVSVMQRLSSRSTRTFSIGMEDAALDESGYAKSVAEYLKTEHSELLVSADLAANVIQKIPVLYDEPLADSSQIPTYMVAHLARAQVTVALSGDGGDEIFCGYQRYAFGKKVAELRGRKVLAVIPTLMLYGGVHHVAPMLPASIGGRFERSRLTVLARWLSASDVRQILELAAEVNRDSFSLTTTSSLRQSRFMAMRPQRLMQEYHRLAMLLDREVYLPDDVLQKVDRATMGVSLESRAPLLDHRIAEFAASLPIEHLVAGRQSKRILRDVLYKVIPRELVDRPKAGFSIPLGKWLREPLRDWGRELLKSRKLSEFMNMKNCENLFDAHLRGDRDLSLACWPIFSALAWAEEWL